jgi:hypothetical protein
MLSETSLLPLLKTCPQPLALSLLSRKVKGEDRQYLYRIECTPHPLQLAIDYNKAARINLLKASAD